ncbi:MAG: hypothetical protein H6817_06600 [Phycisphaerales bacterium]|nr:hypothetical protein [Phycisphaerales bacterium]
MRRRGAGYMLVLGAAMLLAVIGYASIIMARVNTRIVTGTNDWAEAGVLAISAVESGIEILDQNANWRSAYDSGVESASWKQGRGAASFMLVDEADGKFDTEDSEKVRIYGIGRVGDAVRVRSVLLTPGTSTPLDCLEPAMTTASDQSWSFGGSLTADKFVHTDGSFSTILGFTVNADVEAGGALNLLGTMSGSTTTGVDDRVFPNAATVFEHYESVGTSISRSALPVKGGILGLGGTLTIENEVLTVGYNSISGVTNGSGVYVIDCDGNPLTIRDSRIDATLVLIDAPSGLLSSSIKVEGYVLWKPALPNYPALMVDGDVTFGFVGGEKFNEADLGVNLNPVGANYNGVEDSALDDTYVSKITGLVYAAGDVEFSGNSPTFDGMLVSDGGASNSGSANITIMYGNRAYLEPPPGFGTGSLEPVAGTWQWDALP